MDRKIIAIFIIVPILAVLVLNFLGILYPLNNIFPQNPNTFCRIDSDCKPYVQEWNSCKSGCGSCKLYDINDNEVIAINKYWNTFCPFTKPKGSGFCPACIGGIGGDFSSIKCIENKCQKILK
ncbi:MAG: hypothetical protein AABX51_07600 [Nanoarchaeota archaeon]